jgi:hypothetical protein
MAWIVGKYLAPFAGLAALALAVYFYVHTPHRGSYHLRLTAGNAAGMRHRLAEQFGGEVVARRITLDLEPSLGSEQALDWVNEWMKMAGQLTRHKGLHRYIAEVARIEARALEIEDDGPLATAELRALHTELCKLKTHALREFARGELAGRELLAAFLLQANDVRDHLARQIARDAVAPG